MRETALTELSIKGHKIRIKIYNALPCECEVFTIDGVDVRAYDFLESFSEPQDCGYGCENRYYERLRIKEVREHLPDELKTLDAEVIEDIQYELMNRLATGTCGWCI